MITTFQIMRLMAEEMKAFEQFGGVFLPWSKQQLLRLEIQRPVTRPDGCTELVTMSQWHWLVFSWFIVNRGYELNGTLQAVDRIAEDYPYSLALKWWLEIAFEEVCRLQDEGRAVTA